MTTKESSFLVVTSLTIFIVFTFPLDNSFIDCNHLNICGEESASIELRILTRTHSSHRTQGKMFTLKVNNNQPCLSHVWPPTYIYQSNLPPQVLMPLVSLASLASSLPSTAAASRGGGGGGVTRVKRILRQGKQMKELQGAAKTFDQNMLQIMKVFWKLLGLTILLYLPEPRAHVPS